MSLLGPNVNTWSAGAGTCPDMCESNLPAFVDPDYIVTLASFTYIMGDDRLRVYQDGFLVDAARITEIDETSFSIQAYVEGDEPQVVICVIGGVPVE